MKTLLTAFATAATLAVASIAPLQAQTYPEKPVTLVVPFPPGASLGNVARIVGERLQARLAQSFVVDFKAGASGTIGSANVARATPDGYTLLMSATGPMSVAPVVYKNLPYKSEELTPIVQLTKAPYVVVVRSDFPGNSVGDLVKHLKQSPGKYNYASTGNGTLVHLSGELFLQTTGTKAEHIPYQGGSQSTVALIAGDVLYSVTNISNVSPFIKDGRLKALAVTSKERFSLMPDVPTVAESGFPDFDVNLYVGLFGPKGLPAPIVDRLNTEILSVIQEPSVIEAFATQLDLPADLQTPAEFTQRVRQQADAWGRVARDLDIQIN